VHEFNVIYLCILVGLVGLILGGGIILSGYHFFLKRETDCSSCARHEKCCCDPSYSRLHFRKMDGRYSEYLQRRNEYLTAYGQIILAIFIVIVLAILLLAEVISAEAGLPVLSGVSGFAIAKTASSGRVISDSPDNNRER